MLQVSGWPAPFGITLVADLLASMLVVAVGIAYGGYLINGEMPFIEDPRGMSAVGLILGIAAFLMDAFLTSSPGKRAQAVCERCGGSPR